MASTFDPLTAYARDYRFLPGVQKAQLARAGHAKKFDFFYRETSVANPAYAAVIESMGCSPTDVVWEYWKSDLTDMDPISNDRATKETEPTAVYLLGAVRKLPWGPQYLVRATKGVTDG